MKKKANGTTRINKPWPTKDAKEQVYEMKLWVVTNPIFIQV